MLSPRRSPLPYSTSSIPREQQRRSYSTTIRITPRASLIMRRRYRHISRISQQFPDFEVKPFASYSRQHISQVCPVFIIIGAFTVLFLHFVLVRIKPQSCGGKLSAGKERRRENRYDTESLGRMNPVATLPLDTFYFFRGDSGNRPEKAPYHPFIVCQTFLLYKALTGWYY